MRRVVWFLDFDGVVNASKPPWGQAPHHDEVPFWYGGHLELWRVRWAPELVQRIRAVHALPQVEIRWSSTWCTPGPDGEPQVRTLERALRLPKLRCAFLPGVDWHQGTMGASKRLATWYAYAAGDDVIWTDDEWVPDPGHPLHEELTRNGRGLLIRPRESRGLTREDLDRIEAFVGRT